jgi:hypothetical protein
MLRLSQRTWTLDDLEQLDELDLPLATTKDPDDPPRTCIERRNRLSAPLRTYSCSTTTGLFDGRCGRLLAPYKSQMLWTISRECSSRGTFERSQ